MTVPALRSGSQIAGLHDGSWLGSQGKAQAPSSGQTLPFLIGAARLGCDALFGSGEVMLVVGITAQEFLREIRKIVSRIVPSRHDASPDIRLSVLLAQTGQARHS